MPNEITVKHGTSQSLTWILSSQS